jgi:hypothetical protein
MDEKQLTQHEWNYLCCDFTTHARYRLANWLAHGALNPTKTDVGVLLYRRDWTSNKQCKIVYNSGNEEFLQYEEQIEWVIH